jgi:hypothetical protein
MIIRFPFGFLSQWRHSNNNDGMKISDYTLFTEYNPINWHGNLSETTPFPYLPPHFRTCHPISVLAISLPYLPPHFCTCHPISVLATSFPYLPPHFRTCHLISVLATPFPYLPPHFRTCQDSPFLLKLQWSSTTLRLLFNSVCQQNVCAYVRCKTVQCTKVRSNQHIHSLVWKWNSWYSPTRHFVFAFPH